MVKMKIHSKFEDLQMSRLNEFFLVANKIRKAGCGAQQGLDKFKCNKPNPSGNGGARASTLTSNENLSLADGSFDLSSRGSHEALSVPSFPLLGSPFNKEGKNASQTSADPATLSDPMRCQLLDKGVQANSLRSDGGLRENHLQRSSPPITHRDTSTRTTTSATEASSRFSHTQVPPKKTPPFLRISNLTSAIAGQGSGSESLGAIAARQVAREDLSTAKAKEPNERSVIRKKPTISATAPPNPTLITHPSNGPGTTSFAGEDTQGPSPVDYSLELEADFPMDMMFEMQENVAKKTRRTVIGRTLGGKATFKALHECLKLHLLASFISAMLLMRGYFKILFENEEGAIATRKFTTIEWNGLSLSFSKYTPNFNANSQGAQALLTHTIKIQFPDLHE
jgi:hypothetical protein